MLKMTARLAILCTFIFPAFTPADSPPEVKMNPVYESANRFALDLYGKAGAPDENLIFSPYSIDVALSMTAAGARGETQNEMSLALHWDDPIRNFQSASPSLMIFGGKNSPIQIANALWGQKGVEWTPAFLDVLKNSYHANLANLDFAQAEEARKTINDWIAKQTNDKIKDLIPAGSLDSSTRLVLTNAVYFKADWEDPFESDSTHDADFHADGKPDSIRTPMMNRTGNVAFMENDDLSALQMTYKGSDLAMLILLPKKPDGLAALESKLDEKQLSQIISGLSRQLVQISIPKFKITGKFSVAPALKSLGMNLAFSDQADFSGMDGQHDLLISDVVHQAYVAVDEKGTEAAAATGTIMRATAVRPPATVFNADHPFMFIIRDQKTGVILFMGRMRNPAAKP